MRYRRAFVPGGSYFFTVVTHQRHKLFTCDVSIDLLRHAFRKVMKKYPFSIDAIVILPDHIHCIWTLPPGDANFATRWRLIKTYMTQRMSDYAAAPLIRPTVWQKRYWEHAIRDETDFRAHVDYIHYNPVRHGYVRMPVTSDWGAGEIALPEGVGRE
jgi:putative transposase